MLKSISAALAAMLVCSGVAAADEDDENARPWRLIMLNGARTVDVPGQEGRVVEPSCSGALKSLSVDPSTGTPIPVFADAAYGFFVQQGDPRRVLIHHDGGGACWDALTCVGSPLAGSSTYVQELDFDAINPANRDGIFSDADTNPYRNHTKIVIPYCTGDIHLGDRDTTYILSTPALPFPVQSTVRHRGFDNFLAALDWVIKNGESEMGFELNEAREVAVTGESGGALGSRITFSYIAEMARDARQLDLVSDAFVGVAAVPFYHAAFVDAAGVEGSWGVLSSLPSFVPGLNEALLTDAAAFPDSLTTSVLGLVADAYPMADLAITTSDFDPTQIGFFALMSGKINPDGTPLPEAICEWSFRMRSLTDATEAAIPFQYASFVEQDGIHAALGGEAFFVPRASGVSFAEFASQMNNPGKRNSWKTIDVGRVPPGCPF